MATKYQDSTPQRKVWKVGQVNDPFAWNTWGYDSGLIALKVDGGITSGTIVFEGYVGFKDEDGTVWGDWYPVAATDVLTGDKYASYGFHRGTNALLSKIVGFSQFRVRESMPLAGEGSVQITLAFHAV